MSEITFIPLNNGEEMWSAASESQFGGVNYYCGPCNSAEGIDSLHYSEGTTLLTDGFGFSSPSLSIRAQISNIDVLDGSSPVRPAFLNALVYVTYPTSKVDTISENNIVIPITGLSDGNVSFETNLYVVYINPI